MEKFLRKTLSLALALSLIMSLMSFTASAEEESADTGYTYTNPYVLNYSGTITGYEDYDGPDLYYSPHRGSMGIRDLDSGRMIFWNVGMKMYNLIDTTKINPSITPTTAYASIPAYCTDACISARTGFSYRRINLEDCTYYDDTTSGRLRAILLNSFPYIQTMSTIEASVNAWLEETEGADSYTPIDGLTTAEALSATQYVIWLIANANDVSGSIESTYTHTDSYTKEDFEGSLVYYGDTSDPLDVVKTSEAARYDESGQVNLTEHAIETLAEYLYALAPVPAQRVTISDAAFENLVYGAEKQEDGTYTVSVHFDVAAAIGSQDALTLSAVTSLSGARQTVSLTQSGPYSFTFTGLDTKEAVKLEINGHQVGADVYLFDSDGARDVSQTLIGFDESRLPVHAETTLVSSDLPTTGGASVTLSKTGDQSEPIQGAKFDLYLKTPQVVEGLDETRYTETKLNDEALITDAEGQITIHHLDPNCAYILREVEAAPGYLLASTGCDMELVNLTTDETTAVSASNSLHTCDLTLVKTVENTSTDEHFPFYITLNLAEADLLEPSTALSAREQAAKILTAIGDTNFADNAISFAADWSNSCDTETHDAPVTFTADDANPLKYLATVLLKHGELLRIQGIPSGTAYTVVEPDTHGYSIRGMVEREQSLTGDTTVHITNTLPSSTPDSGPSYTSRTVKKVWQDDNRENRPASIRVQLMMDGEPYGSPATLTSESWSKTWNSLPLGHSWSVVELDVPEGYTSTVDDLTITNTYAPTTETDGDDDTEFPEEGPSDTSREDPTEETSPDADPVEESFPDEGPAEETTPSTSVDIPKTGDNVAFWLALSAVSGVGLVFLMLSQKKRGRQES